MNQKLLSTVIFTLWSVSLFAQVIPFDRNSEEGIDGIPQYFGEDRPYKFPSFHTRMNTRSEQDRMKLTGRSPLIKLMDSVEFYDLDASANEILKSKYTIKYDSEGKYIYNFGFRYNADGSILPRYQTNYTYDSKAQLSEYIYDNWDDAIKDWVHSTKVELEYNAEGLYSVIRNYRYESNEFVSSSLWVYHYNTDKRLVLFEQFQFDPTVKEFIPSSITEYTYDSLGNKIREEDSYWDANTNSFVLAWLLEDVYQGILLIERYKKYWNKQNSTWKPHLKFEYEYNAAGYNTITSSFLFVENRMEFVPSTRYIYTRDTEHDVVLYFTENWDGNSNKYVPYTLRKNYYSIHNLISESSSLSHDSEEISFLPNPAHDYIIVDLPEDDFIQSNSIRLIDVHGRIVSVWKNVGSSNNRLDLQNMSSGLYMLSVESKKGIKSVKLVID
ncbi:MAG: T9SS type A sorting domain-containing protein [Saprospiraceae bacterium]|nr:T9SS type A sorting domain-containing protein [Saprospiraceae bacterium]